MLTRLRLLLLAGLALASCRVSLESFCDENVRAECEARQRCGFVSRAVDCSRRTSVSDCLDGTRSGVETGVVKYDAEASAACIHRGAHLLLQTRTRVVNGELEATFREWYPGMKAANDAQPESLREAA